MKISILLPTRDRLQLLRRAVESVLRLEDDNCELVISDNDSAEDVAGYAASLADPRVVYTRTSRLLPVTENWNHALDRSSGDYVLMLGDDDALLSSYFTKTRALIAEFGEPQVVYHNALVYAYPGVVPDAPNGFLRSEGYADFLRDADAPFVLEPARAAALARAAMHFRLRYGFNMQFVTVSRGLVIELSRGGPFYRSPFPDYYAMNHLFLRARSVVAEPEPLVVIGVSGRSYGFFHNNRLEGAGRSFLQGEGAAESSDDAGRELLPGTYINDGWLRAMQELHRELGSPADLRPDVRRYRMLQILFVYEGHYLRSSVGVAELGALQRHMTRLERAVYGAAFAVIGRLYRLLPGRRGDISAMLALAARQFPAWDPGHDPDRYRDILDVVEQVDPQRYPRRFKTLHQSRLRAAIARRLA